MRETMKMKEFLELPKTQLVQDMEIFEKLDDYVCNYENMAAMYGAFNKDARETLFRGVRNAFLLGKGYAEELAKREEN